MLQTYGTFHVTDILPQWKSKKKTLKFTHAISIYYHQEACNKVLLVYKKLQTLNKTTVVFTRYLQTSLVVQRLRLQAPNAGGPGSIPFLGTRFHMPQLKTWCSQIKKIYILYIYIKRYSVLYMLYNKRLEEITGIIC